MDRLAEEELTAFGPSLSGLLLSPQESGVVPDGVVVVCPERYGLVQHTVDVAARFRDAGYLTVVPDFYTGIPTSADGTLPRLSDDEIHRNISGALSFVARATGQEVNRAAVYGVCRSGSWGLVASARIPVVRAVIMLYGGAGPREFAVNDLRRSSYADIVAASTAPVLAIFGERDHTMSVDHVARLRDLFEQARRSYDCSIVRDMPHGWINDTMPGRYRHEEAEQVWRRMLAFLPSAFEGDGQDVSWRFAADIAPDYDFSANERLE